MPLGKLGEAEVEVRLDNSKIKKDAKEAGDIVEREGKKAGNRAGQKMGGGIGRGLKRFVPSAKNLVMNVFGGLGKLASTAFSAAFKVGVAGVGAVIGTTLLITKKFRDLNDELKSVAARTGIARDELHLLRNVAERLGSEDGLEGIVDSAQELALRLNDLTEEGYRADQALTQLGLSGEELRNKAPTEALLDTIKALQGVEDQQQRNLLADELFGGSWEKIAGILGVSVEEFENLIDVQREHNGHLQDALIQADRISNGWQYLKDQMSSATQQLFATFGPAIEWLIATLLLALPAIGSIPSAFRDALIYFRDTILPNFKDDTGNLIGIFQSINEFLTGIWMGDWERAWRGIQNIAIDAVNYMLESIDKYIHAIRQVVLLTSLATGNLGLMAAVRDLIPEDFTVGRMVKKTPNQGLPLSEEELFAREMGMDRMQGGGEPKSVLESMLDRAIEGESNIPYWFDTIFAPPGSLAAGHTPNYGGVTRGIERGIALAEKEEKAKKAKAKRPIMFKDNIIADDTKLAKMVAGAEHLNDRTDYVSDTPTGWQDIYGA